MAEGLEESVYTSLREALNSDDFLIDEVEVAYVSQEYLDELQYNSQENVFFGYTLPEIRDYFEGAPYVFTVENGATVVKPFEDYDDTWERVAVNVATGPESSPYAQPSPCSRQRLELRRQSRPYSRLQLAEP